MRKLEYFLNRYLWLFIVAIPLIALIPFTTTHTTKDFFSVSDPGFNSSANPLWIVHTSDLLLDSDDETLSHTVKSRLKTAVAKLNPNKLFISGNICQNTGNSSFNGQKSADWALYSDLLSEISYPFDDIIASAGNKDVFNVKSFDSSSNYAAKLVFNGTRFPITSQIINSSDGDIALLGLNPYTFPSPPLKLIDWVVPTNSFKKSLLSIVANDSNIYSIISAHTPISHWYPITGSEARSSILQILLASNNARLFLDGKRSLSQPQVIHHGDTLEVIGTSLAKLNEVGLVTIDNRRVIYHQINLNASSIVVMTCPAPVSQSSGYDVFDQASFEIRALAFTEDDLNLSITGAIQGKLIKQRVIKSGVTLYSLPVNVSNGYHTIQMVGDWSGDRQFHVGTVISGLTEGSSSDEASVAWIYLFFFFLLFASALVVPLHFSRFNDHFNDFLNEKVPSFSQYYVLFGGIFEIHNSIQRSPPYLRYTLLICLIWVICLPICFFGIEGQASAFWVWGFISNTNTFLFYGFKFGLLFIIAVFFPFCLFISAVETTLFKSTVIFFDGIIMILSVVFDIYIITLLNDIFPSESAWTSPLFVFAPAILIAELVIWTFKLKKMGRNENESALGYEVVAGN